MKKSGKWGRNQQVQERTAGGSKMKKGVQEKEWATVSIVANILNKVTENYFYHD